MRTRYLIEISHPREIDGRQLHTELLEFANNNICTFTRGTLVFGDAPEDQIQRILAICEDYGDATLKRYRAA